MNVLFLTKTDLEKNSGAAMRDEVFIDFYQEEYGAQSIDVLSLFLDSSRNAVIKEFNSEREEVKLSDVRWYIDLVYNVIRGLPNYSAMRYIDEQDYIEDYDIVHVETPFVYPLGKRLAELNEAELIFDEHNVEHHLIRQNRGLLGLWFSARMKKIENQAVKQADLSLCCSERDSKKLCGIPQVIPNSVKSEDYNLNAPMPPEYSEGEKKALFLGSMGYKPNEEAALIIVEEIAPTAPGWEFYIVGRGPSQELREKADNVSNVDVVGEVPKVDPYIANAEVCLAPLVSGSGTRLKILEYLAFHKPVISTKKGAEGIESEYVFIEEQFSNYPDIMEEAINKKSQIDLVYTREYVKEKLHALFEENNI